MAKEHGFDGIHTWMFNNTKRNENDPIQVDAWSQMPWDACENPQPGLRKTCVDFPPNHMHDVNTPTSMVHYCIIV